MLTLIALGLAVFLLPSPWGWIVLITAAAVDLLETGAFVWWSRRRRRLTAPAVGVEDLIGRIGRAATALMPDGQVRVQGEIWAACSPTPVQQGAAVVVRAVDGLVLHVEPREV